MCVLQLCLTLYHPWTVAHEAPLSMGFSRQEYWSGLPCPPPGDLPDPGTERVSLMSPALAGRFFTTSATRKPKLGVTLKFSYVLLQCFFHYVRFVTKLVCAFLYLTF